MFLAFGLYPLLGKLFQKVLLDLRLRNIFIRWPLIFAGCYGAYSLGSNNVANVTGVYAGSGLLTPFQASLIGSLSIVLGVLTYSKKVMFTVGSRLVQLDTVGVKIVKLDGFSAFISEFAAAITVHFFTQVGVPVSTSQAIVGGVTGVGLVKGTKTVQKRTLLEIAIGWVSTPLSTGIVAYLMMRIYLAFINT